MAASWRAVEAEAYQGYAPRPDSPCACWGMQPALIFDKKALRRAAARHSPQLPPMSEWRRPRLRLARSG